MRICLNLDPSRLLRWHLWVAEDLAGMPGNEVSCAFLGARRPLSPVCRLLIEFERLVFGSRGSGATDPMQDALRSLPQRADGEIDLVIDFSGEGKRPVGSRVLTPLFNGAPGEVGVMAAVAKDQDLLIELYDSARPLRPWTARPASADREVFSASLDSILACASALIAKAVREGGCSSSEPAAPAPAADTPSLVPLSVLARAARTAASKAARLLDALARGGRAWGIGWRLDESAGLLDRGEAAFRVLTGGVHSYLADPFPFRHKGQDFIFVEQYPYATNRGCIAVVTVDRSGAVGAPRIILEEPYHLSYPFVFEHAGQIWMIPEGGEAEKVCLYRAVEFPYRWTREACLAEGFEAYDATPLFHRDCLWFFVCLRSRKSTSWDMLGLYRADSLTGSWTAHARNPVVIDATLSRPAGAFIRQGGRLLRPVQDCARGYGGGVAFYRLDTLDDSRFEQTPVGRIRSGPFGCHTYNRWSGLEVIDLFGHLRGSQEVVTFYGPPHPTWRQRRGRPGEPLLPSALPAGSLD